MDFIPAFIYSYGDFAVYGFFSTFAQKNGK